jgi:hypothetical protein
MIVSDFYLLKHYKKPHGLKKIKLKNLLEHLFYTFTLHVYLYTQYLHTFAYIVYKFVIHNIYMLSFMIWF